MSVSAPNAIIIRQSESILPKRGTVPYCSTRGKSGASEKIDAPMSKLKENIIRGWEPNQE